MTAVGFEPTPLRNGALSHRLRPLGQTVLLYMMKLLVYPRKASSWAKALYKPYEKQLQALYNPRKIMGSTL